MKNVRTLIEQKGRGAWSIEHDRSTFEALEILADKNIGALLVMEGEKLAGIFSERDYARKVILKGKTSRETPVSELMTRAIITIDPEVPLKDCLAVMTANHIRHLPVVDNGELLGIITLGDVVKVIISDQATTINDLESFITGNVYTAV